MSLEETKIKPNKNKINIESIKVLSSSEILKSDIVRKALQGKLLELPSFAVITGKNGTKKSNLLRFINECIFRFNRNEQNIKKICCFYRNKNLIWQHKQQITNIIDPVNFITINHCEEEEILLHLRDLIEYKLKCEDCIKCKENVTSRPIENNFFYIYSQIFLKQIDLENKSEETELIEELCKLYLIDTKEGSVENNQLKKSIETFYEKWKETLYVEWKDLKARFCDKHFLKIMNILNFVNLEKNFEKDLSVEFKNNLENQKMLLENSSDNKSLRMHYNLLASECIINCLKIICEYTNEKLKNIIPFSLTINRLFALLCTNIPIPTRGMVPGSMLVSITPRQFSSGQVMLFKMVFWSFSNHIDVLLLDEPDMHFDPEFTRLFFKLAKELNDKGTQIIMISHRTDTVALAPEGSLFELKSNDSNLELIPCHKLQVLFNLTPNLREVINFNVRVYVEAHDDANFYTGIHRTLLVYCDRVRDEKKFKQNRFDWDILSSDINRRVLSRRYYMEFYSTCFENKGSGGKSAVVNLIKRECARINNTIKSQTESTKKRLIEPELELPFGLIDMDYDDANKKMIEKDENLNERVIILKRHSVESFIYDPIILASTFERDELTKLLENKNDDFKTTLLQINSDLIKIKEIKDQESEQLKNFQDNLDKYFKEVLKNVFKNPKTALIKMYNLTNEELKETSAVDRLLKGDNLKKIKVIVDEKNFLNINYPTFFLKLRGHDIEPIIEKSFNKEQKKNSEQTLKQALINKISIGIPQLCLPEDLIDCMLELNKKIIEQTRNIIKKTPEKIVKLDQTVDHTVNRIRM